MQKTIDADDIVVDAANRRLAVEDMQEVIERKQRREDGKIWYRTSIKKPFIYFPKNKQQKSTMEIMVSTGFPYKTRASNIVFNAVPVIVLAKELEKKGIKTQITFLNASKYLDGDETINTIIMIPIKHYDQQLNIDYLGVIIGSPQYFRAIIFFYYVLLCELLNVTVHPQFGYSVSMEDVVSYLHKTSNKKTMKKFQEQRNLPYQPCIYLNKALSIKEAEHSIQDGIEQIKRLEAQKQYLMDLKNS